MNAHTERVPLRIEGPLDGLFGRLATLLHLAYYLERKPAGHVVAAHQRSLPDLVSAAKALLEGGLLQAARDGAPLEDYLASAPIRFLPDETA